MPQKKMQCHCKQKMSEGETPTTEVLHGAPEEDTKVPSQKRARTEAQVAALSRAREEAMKVRQQNAELRRKEKEIDRVTLAQAKEDKRQRIEREYSELTKTAPPIQSDPQEETPQEEKPRRKKKPARKVIVTEASSGSEEEEVEVVLPRQKKPMSAEQLAYQRAYSKMFEYQ